jgi:hypothetical protein
MHMQPTTRTPRIPMQHSCQGRCRLHTVAPRATAGKADRIGQVNSCAACMSTGTCHWRGVAPRHPLLNGRPVCSSTKQLGVSSCSSGQVDGSTLWQLFQMHAHCWCTCIPYVYPSLQTTWKGEWVSLSASQETQLGHHPGSRTQSFIARLTWLWQPYDPETLNRFRAYRLLHDVQGQRALEVVGDVVAQQRRRRVDGQLRRLRWRRCLLRRRCCLLLLLLLLLLRPIRHCWRRRRPRRLLLRVQWRGRQRRLWL